MGGIKSRKPKAKTDQHDEVTSQLAQSQPFHQQILKREHADHEVFVTKSFPFDELVPNWKGDLFDPHFMNAATRQTFMNKHHVKGEGVKKRSDFERLEFGFCLEWIDRNMSGAVVRDRCYNQFTVKSQGCSNHPKAVYKDGPNAVYYRMLRGDACNWGMLKDSEAPVVDDTRRAWSYIDWRNHALTLAQEEADMAASQGCEDCEGTTTIRMTEFENWWRLEEKKDKRQGGAQAAAARGYPLVGTRSVPPAFMSHQPCGLSLIADDPLPASNGTMINGPIAIKSEAFVNTRLRFGKDTTDGRPDLEAKRLLCQQLRGKKSQAAKYAIPENDSSFFSSFKKDRKPRRDDKPAGDQNGQA
ncbi:hypothetical protein SVAN01_06384 [Stagonosporopsis vannaccii]|nr:hypothetical protein SVAN01_06384 [Stagonosporopsis vannaccii]